MGMFANSTPAQIIKIPSGGGGGVEAGGGGWLTTFLGHQRISQRTIETIGPRV